jgi:hypothetical protein
LCCAIAAQSVIGASSSGAFVTSSATIRASAPLADPASAARVQKSISGRRLISDRNGKSVAELAGAG